MYSEMQNRNEHENKAEPGTHLCIDVEDAVSTLLLRYIFYSVVEYARQYCYPFQRYIGIFIFCLQPE